MKKFWIIATLVAFVTLLPACSSSAKQPDTIKASKEVVQPYKFSAEETRLLTSFGMESKAHVFAFKAPANAKVLHVNIYRLNKDGAWEGSNVGEVLLSENDPPTWKLEGNVALLANEDHSFTYRINTMGSASYTSDPVDANTRFLQKADATLVQEKVIELGKEIPVFLSVYGDGMSMESFSVDDYFSPEKFKQMDLVQAVIIRFTS
jgi:hypothetical protein